MSDEDNDPGELVFGDIGGWISGSCLDAAQLAAREHGGPRFGLNVGAWMEAYPGYVLQGGFDGFGFVCWRRNGEGRKSGTPIIAATLDELAVLVEHREAGGGRSGPR